MMNINRLTIIGVMSGTSLDGLDLVKCHFIKRKSSIESLNLSFRIIFCLSLFVNKTLTDSFGGANPKNWHLMS